jgi:hypothetical protein
MTNLKQNFNQRKDLSLKFTILIFMFLLSVNSYSQSRKTLSPSPKNAIIKNVKGGLTETVLQEQSDEAIEISRQIDQIRRSGDEKSDNKINDLRIRYDEISNNTVTVNPDFKNGISNFRKVSNRNTDNITRADVFSGNYLVASATQVEQSGPSSGKIWLIIGVAQADTGISSSGDSLLLFSSVDNGQTFSLITSIQANTAIKVNRDQLDMEIIESASGIKYLYVTLGYTAGGYSGDKKITLLVFDNAGNFNESLLSIPGYSTSSDYYLPRITSDNSTYPTLAYVNIVFMQDSIAGSNHFLMSKMIRIYNPYTLSPSVTYFPLSIYTPVGSLSNNFRAQTDVAYFNNSTDSLIFVLSAYPGFGDGVFIYKANASINVYPNFKMTLGSVYSGDEIENARVASNGGFNNPNIMITFSDNYFNTGDFDQWIFSTGDAANWTATNVDFSGNFNSVNGDIVGKRLTSGSYNIAFNNNNSCKASVASAEIKNNSVFNYVFNLNDSYAFSFLHPKPAFRNISNDSALTIWGSYYSLYSTGGSNAIRINVGAAIEGLFNTGTNNHVIDDYISFYLHSNTFPYNIVDSARLISYSCSLNNAVVFNNAPDGDYYIAVKYRNAIEIWSAGSLSLANSSSWQSYNFVSSAANTYGNNVKLVGSAWCLFSGDVNQDGTIDASDVSEVDNDALSSLSGFVNTDVTGDSFVDAQDVSIVDNNAFNSVSVITP